MTVGEGKVREREEGGACKDEMIERGKKGE